MTVSISIEYQGSLRCEAVHGPSGTRIVTDAPVDNHGKGESFSPTDLAATSFGTCMMTVMAIVAERHGIDLTGSTVSVEKHMVADPQRRIARLPATIRVPAALEPKQQKLLERAALTCPVHHSLDPRIESEIRFEWSGSAAGSKP